MLLVSLVSNNQSDLKLRWSASSNSWPLKILSVNPSRLVTEIEVLVATESDMGKLIDPRVFVSP